MSRTKSYSKEIPPKNDKYSGLTEELPGSLETASFFFRYLLPRAQPLFYLYSAIFLGIILGLLPPLITKFLVDEVYSSRNMGMLVACIGAGVSVEILIQLVFRLEQYMRFYLGQVISFNLKKDAMRVFEILPLSFYGKRSTGEYQVRLSADLDNTKAFIVGTVPDLVSTLVQFLVLFFVTLYFDIWLAILVLMILPIYYLKGFFVFKKMNLFDQSIQTQDSKIQSFIRQNVSGMEEVKTSRLERTQIRRYLTLVREKLSLDTMVNITTTVYGMSNSLLSTLWSWSITAYLGVKMVQGRLTMGELLAISMYVFRITGPVNKIADIYGTWVAQLVSMRRVFPLFKEKPEMNNPIYSRRRLTGGIDIKDVHFRYNEWVPVINGVSLYITPGERIAFVGANGSGKTTLMRLLLGLYPVDQGTISYGGLDPAFYHPWTVRTNTAIVLQRPFLFAGTVAENLTLGDKNADWDEIIRVMKEIGIYEYFQRMAKGFDTEVGEEGSFLSGGQRQLVAICRAFVRRSPIVVFDEGTSALDPMVEQKILVAMNQRLKGQTILFVSHRMNTLKYFDKVVYMRDGRIAEIGSVETLMAQKGYFHALYSNFFADKNGMDVSQGNKKYAGIWIPGREMDCFASTELVSVAMERIEGQDVQGLKVDLSGIDGYKDDLLVVKKFSPEFIQGRVRTIGLDVFVPKETMEDEKYLLMHLVAHSEKFGYKALEVRRLNYGWNYLLFGVDDPDILKDCVLRIVFIAQAPLKHWIFITNPMAEIDAA